MQEQESTLVISLWSQSDVFGRWVSGDDVVLAGIKGSGEAHEK